MTAHGKQVAKQRPKIVANLAELKQFPLVSRPCHSPLTGCFFATMQLAWNIEAGADGAVVVLKLCVLQLDEDALLNTAAALVEARRQMAEGLGAAIHKRAGR